MKNIQVTDEMHDFLMELSKEINSQDHRGTAMPYFFQVQDIKEIVTGDGMGEKVWVMDGEVCLRTDEEIKAAVFEYQEWTIGDKSHEAEYAILHYWERDSILENNYTSYDVGTEEVYKNSFFTAKACKEHIEANNHHYSQANDFLSHGFRNPELEGVMKFLCELTGGKLHT